MGSLKGTARGSRSFFPTQFSLVFVSRSCGDLISLALEPWAGGPGVGLGLLTVKISLLNFYPPYTGKGPVPSMSVPLLPVLMDVVSFIL